MAINLTNEQEKELIKKSGKTIKQKNNAENNKEIHGQHVPPAHVLCQKNKHTSCETTELYRDHKPNANNTNNEKQWYIVNESALVNFWITIHDFILTLQFCIPL